MSAAARTAYVVVVNYNRWRDTAECLESVLRSDYVDVRVVVVDNKSTDDSRERLIDWARGTWPFSMLHRTALDRLSTPPVAKPVRHMVLSEKSAAEQRADGLPALTFINAETNGGFAAGNNVAFRLLLSLNVSGFICLINNDMVIAPHSLRALVCAIEEEKNVGAVGGVILDYQSADVAQVVGGGKMSRLGMSQVCGAGESAQTVQCPGPLGYVTGGLLLTRIETLRDIGLMDEGYFLYAEDADWGERMREHGYDLKCALDAVVWHKGSVTTGAGSPFQDYHIVRSSLRFVRKNWPAYLPIAVPNLLMRCLGPKLFRAQWQRARSVARAHLDELRGAPSH